MMRSFYKTFLFLVPFLGSTISCEAPSQGTEPPSALDVEELETCTEPPPEWDEGSERKARRIRNFFRKKERKGRFNGTVLFAEKGRILHKGSYGHRNLHERDSLKLSDPFQLASVSKALTATLILRLREQGYLELQDSLSNYFEDWPYPGITIEMLLTHRSGLPNYMYFMEDYWKGSGTYENEDVLKVMVRDTPDVYYVPDHRYNYCNTNYCLLALIAERCSDRSFLQLMKDELTEASRLDPFGHPLHMGPEEAPVQGHNKFGEPITDYRNRVLGDKGLFASAEELYRFDKALRSGELLPDSILERAYEPHHNDLYSHDNYGLGWRIDRSNPTDRMVWHNGWWKGFRTYFIRLLERNATIIVLNNTTRGNFLSNRALVRLLFPHQKNKSS